MPIVISGTDLAKSYDAHPLFSGVSLGIEAGSRVGIIGPNGSGKSTLLRIFAGEEQPDSGERALASGTRLVWLPQQDIFPADATALSVVMAAQPGDDDHERETRTRLALQRAGFDTPNCPGIEQSVATLSGGWRKRLAIIRALAQEPDLLLADEPTNHLDLEGIWWLERLLNEARFTLVVVSHDRFFLERVATRVVEINQIYPGGCFAALGGYSSFIEKRAEFIANQRKQQDVLDNVVRREVEWLRANPSAQTCKAKARVDRAGDLQENLAALKYRNGQDRRVSVDFAATGRRTNDLVVLTGVGKGLGGRPLFSDVDCTLSPGTRLGVMGLNGAGKSTFLKLLTRQLAPDTGTVKHASELRIEVFDQQRARLDPKQTLRQALCPTGEMVIVRGRGMHVAAWARRFLFQPAQLDLTVGRLSGGEQSRVLLADIMRREADLLVLDEPTNDLDIPSLEVLEAGLRDFPGAVVLVTHDRYLLDRVSTTQLALDGLGNAYRVADCAQWEDLVQRMQGNRGGGSEGTGRKAKQSLAREEKRELERIQSKIEQAEQHVTAAEAQTADPAVVIDGVRLQAACADLAKAQAVVERLYARWGELEARAK